MRVAKRLNLFTVSEEDIQNDSMSESIEEERKFTIQKGYISPEESDSET
jgi:hypothetical protein